MIQLMIVEDEYFVRRGIIDSIDWKEYDISVCGEAASGEEALQLLGSIHPDIVLTDIRMSDMDGMTLITKATVLYPHIRFVILTGYSDFEYARKAISLHVSEYLLKPIGAEELISVVTKIAKQITYSRNEPAIQQDPLMGLALQWKGEIPPLDMTSSTFLALMFTVDNLSQLRANNQNISIDTPLYDWLGIAEEYFVLSGVRHIPIKRSRYLFSVLLNYDDLPMSLQTLLQCFTDFMQQKTNANLTVSVGKPHQGYQHVLTTYNEAFSAMGLRIKDKEHFHFATDLPFDNAPRYFHDECMDHLLPLEARMENSFVKGENFGPDYLDKLWEEVTSFHLPSETIQIFCQKILILFSCLPIIDTRNKRIQGILTAAFEENNYWHVCAESEHFRQTILALIESRETTEGFQAADPVRIVMTYIASHYAETISLRTLSEMVYVTPNYLSKLFKNHTGENFHDWLIKYRIDVAKKLLKQPEYKIYEVAQAVGFRDYKHFSKLFKKYTGCSAKEYVRQ